MTSLTSLSARPVPSCALALAMVASLTLSALAGPGPTPTPTPKPVLPQAPQEPPVPSSQPALIAQAEAAMPPSLRRRAAFSPADIAFWSSPRSLDATLSHLASRYDLSPHQVELLRPLVRKLSTDRAAVMESAASGLRAALAQHAALTRLAEGGSPITPDRWLQQQMEVDRQQSRLMGGVRELLALVESQLPAEQVAASRERWRRAETANRALVQDRVSRLKAQVEERRSLETVNRGASPKSQLPAGEDWRQVTQLHILALRLTADQAAEAQELLAQAQASREALRGVARTLQADTPAQARAQHAALLAKEREMLQALLAQIEDLQ